MSDLTPNLNDVRAVALSSEVVEKVMSLLRVDVPTAKSYIGATIDLMVLLHSLRVSAEKHPLPVMPATNRLDEPVSLLPGFDEKVPGLLYDLCDDGSRLSNKEFLILQQTIFSIMRGRIGIYPDFLFTYLECVPERRSVHLGCVRVVAELLHKATFVGN